MALLAKKCIPCQLGTPPLKHAQILQYLAEISDDWFIDNDKMLKRTYEFNNFKEAYHFVEKISLLSESEGHHPDIQFGWGYATIHLTTHKIKGLSESDFILAAKIDLL